MRQNVWAEVDGEVQEVNVEHDQAVKKGEVLVVQESPDSGKGNRVAQRRAAARSSRSCESTRRELIDNEELTEVERSQKESQITQLTASDRQPAEAARAAEQEERRCFKSAARSTGASSRGTSKNGCAAGR